jgi:hypothetical protein
MECSLAWVIGHGGRRYSGHGAGMAISTTLVFGSKTGLGILNWDPALAAYYVCAYAYAYAYTRARCMCSRRIVAGTREYIVLLEENNPLFIFRHGVEI